MQLVKSHEPSSSLFVKVARRRVGATVTIVGARVVVVCGAFAVVARRRIGASKDLKFVTDAVFVVVVHAVSFTVVGECRVRAACPQTSLPHRSCKCPRQCIQTEGKTQSRRTHRPMSPPRRSCTPIQWCNPTLRTCRTHRQVVVRMRSHRHTVQPHTGADPPSRDVHTGRPNSLWKDLGSERPHTPQAWSIGRQHTQIIACERVGRIERRYHAISRLSSTKCCLRRGRSKASSQEPASKETFTRRLRGCRTVQTNGDPTVS